MLDAAALKGELARIQPARACCRRAELVGLSYAAASAGISTLDHATARIVTRLATSLGGGSTSAGTPAVSRAGRHHLRLALAPALTDGWTWSEAPTCDRRAFLRGVLLASSVSDGPGGLHLEAVLRDAAGAVELRARLAEVGIRAGVADRRGRRVVYVKGREDLATFLRLAGANHSLLDFEAGRVAREVRSRLNRQLNAEEANLGRTVRAADRQLRAIARLEAAGTLDRLADGLREAAAQRRLQPDADLDTLASALGISRSAANHRLRRIVSLAVEVLGEDDRATSSRS